MAALGLAACERPLQIGSDLLPSQGLQTLFTDSLPLQTFTVQTDSAATSQGRAGQVLVGRYTDPDLVSNAFRAYLQFAPEADTLWSYSKFAVYDSLVLHLHSASFYGDTARSTSLTVHQLSAPMDTSRARFFNETSAYNATPVAAVRFRPSFNPVTYSTPGGNVSYYDTLEVKLSDQLGRSIFSRLGYAETYQRARFAQWFGGLALIPGSADNQPVLGFYPNRGTELRLYFHIQNDTVARYFRAIPTWFFSQYVRDCAVCGKAAGVLTPAAQTGNQTFLLAGSGLATKIQLPDLKALAPAGQSVLINRAELLIEPAAQPTGLPLPTGVTLMEAGADNLPLRKAGVVQYVYPEGTAAAAIVARAMPHQTYSNGLYRYNITTYLNRVTQGKLPANGLILKAYGGGPERMAVRSVKLRLFYSITP